MLDKIYSSITDYLQAGQDNILQNKKLISIANKLSSLYSNKSIKIPQLVVVGTQSAGKSSVLNAITQMDILPTGKNMVTRSPIKLELRNNNKNIIEIGYNKNNTYINFKNCDDINNISDIINDLTCKLFGKNNNIGTIPIIIKVNSNFNFSFN